MAPAVAFLVLVSCLLNRAWSQDQVHLTIDRERVYDKENFMLKCSFPSHLGLTSVTLRASNETIEKGSMFCAIHSGISNQTGIFTGSTFAGCPNYPGGSGYVSVTLQASLALELSYNCTFRLNDGSRFFELRSNALRFELSVMPEPVVLNHGVLNFNESDNVTLACYSRHGKPPAVVNLTVTQQEQSPMLDMGNVSAFLQLPQAKRLLNNATVTCKVTNHRFSQNMTYQGVLNINYLNVNNQTHYEADTTFNSAMLNCSTSSNPPAVYSWEYPAEIKGSFSPLNDTFDVTRVSSGVVRCTVLNPVTREHMVVTFNVKYSLVKILVPVIVIICAAVVGIVVFLRCRRKCRRDVRSAGRLPPAQEPCLTQSEEDRQIHPESDRLKTSAE